MKFYFILFLSICLLVDGRVLLNRKRCKLFEFQCGDLSCISEHQVCDYIPDCADSSDEHMCDENQSHIFIKHLNLYDVSEDTTGDPENISTEESATYQQ